jgi:hypothetical protein
MKLNEVLTMGNGYGFSQMAGPGGFTSMQVVQPRTVQANEPEQSGEDFEKLKERQKGLEKIDTQPYNKKKNRVKKNYFDNDQRAEDVAKMVNMSVFSLLKDPEIKMSKNYTEFAKTIQAEICPRPQKSQQ